MSQFFPINRDRINNFLKSEIRPLPANKFDALLAELQQPNSAIFNLSFQTAPATLLTELLNFPSFAATFRWQTSKHYE